MSDKQPAPNQRAGGRPNRRRPLRNKPRGSRPGGEVGEPRPAEPYAREARPDEPRDLAASGSSKILEKAQREQRERRERRRRRRLKAKQRGLAEARPEIVPPIDDLDLPPRPPVFIYTHVIRPAARDGYEFRSEHFSKVTRRLEDFHIDLSPLLHSEEETAKQVQADLLEGLAEELAEDAAEAGEEEFDGEEFDEEETDLLEAVDETWDDADEGDDL
jgi:hypothetical protein